MNITIILLLVSLSIKSLYIPLNRRKSRFYWKVPFDDKIPLIPFFVIPYIFYHVGVYSSYFLLWHTPYMNSFLLSVIVSYAVAIIFWYLFPNGVYRPILLHNSPMYRLLQLIYKHDGDTNGFPSAHVFMSLICGHFISLAFPFYAGVTWLFAVLTILSTIFTKQHYVVDILGGIIVYVMTLFTVTLIMPL